MYTDIINKNAAEVIVNLGLMVEMLLGLLLTANGNIQSQLCFLLTFKEFIYFINNTFLFGTNLTVDIELYNNPKLTTKIQNKQYPSHLFLFYANKSKQMKVNFIRRFIQVKSDINLSLRTYCTILNDFIQVLSGLLKSKYLFKLSI